MNAKSFDGHYCRATALPRYFWSQNILSLEFYKSFMHFMSGNSLINISQVFFQYSDLIEHLRSWVHVITLNLPDLPSRGLPPKRRFEQNKFCWILKIFITNISFYIKFTQTLHYEMNMLKKGKKNTFIPFIKTYLQMFLL